MDSALLSCFFSVLESSARLHEAEIETIKTVINNNEYNLVIYKPPDLKSLNKYSHVNTIGKDIHAFGLFYFFLTNNCQYVLG